MSIENEAQLLAWVDGVPVHLGGANEDECCPDFSCCYSELLAPPETRQAFRDASEEGRMMFLNGFLAVAMRYLTDKKVFLAGDPINEQEPS